MIEGDRRLAPYSNIGDIPALQQSVAVLAEQLRTLNDRLLDHNRVQERDNSAMASEVRSLRDKFDALERQIVQADTARRIVIWLIGVVVAGAAIAASWWPR